MRHIYVVIQSGVYRHAVIGVFEELDDAIAAGHEAVQTERDHYHCAEVLRCPVGGGPEEPVGDVVALWENTPNEDWPDGKPGEGAGTYRKRFKGTRWAPVSAALVNRVSDQSGNGDAVASPGHEPTIEPVR